MKSNHEPCIDSPLSKSKSLSSIEESFRNQQRKSIRGERKANQSEWKFAS